MDPKPIPEDREKGVVVAPTPVEPKKSWFPQTVNSGWLIAAGVVIFVLLGIIISR